MFKKLISYLPYNPSLIAQLGFYSKRLHQETALRRAGFAFMTLAMVVQMFVAMYPAQKSLASAANNIVSGITSKTSILNAWDNNTGNARDIYSLFGITRENISGVTATTISSGDGYWSVGRLSLDRVNGAGSSQQWDERQISVAATDPDTTVYQRPLKAWDNGVNTRYNAFKGTNKYGVAFWIIQDCGNPTFKTSYFPNEPTAAISVHKKILDSDLKVNVGDTVRYMVTYENTVPNSLARNFTVTDPIDSRFEIVSVSGNYTRNGNTVTTRPINLGYGGVAYPLDITVKVRAGVSSGQVLCNQAKGTADGGLRDLSEKQCVTVVIPITVTAAAPKVKTVTVCEAGTILVDSVCIPYCKYPDQRNILSTNPYCGQCPSGQTRNSSTLKCVAPSNAPPTKTVEFCGIPGKEGWLVTDPECVVDCTSSQELFNGSCAEKCNPGDVRQTDGTCKAPSGPSVAPAGVCIASNGAVSGIRDSISINTELASLQNGARASSYEYDVDSNGSWDYKANTSNNPFSYIISRLSTGQHPVTVRVTFINDAGLTSQSACVTTATIFATPQVTETKTVTNLTKSGKNADGATASAGDILEFKMTTKNTTNSDYSNYVAVDYFGDTLEYADWFDRNELSTQGITLDANNNATWKATTIKAGESLTKTLHVKVNKSLARTNQPTTISNSYDCRISNRFGNQVNIDLECPLTKSIEIAANTLPNTGPSAGVAASIVVAIIAGYFFARSRLMAKEIELVKVEFANAGGM